MSTTDTARSAAEWVDPSTLTAWDKNPRNNDPAVESVAKSIERFGFGAPIVARLEDRMVIAGHTRLKAAALLQLERVPVRFLDISPAEAKALALADNKLGEIAEWDDDLLAEVLRELDADEIDLDGLGFSDSELDDLLAEPGAGGGGGGEDEAPPVQPGPAHSKLGKLYELGPHRLVCGDSTSEEAWAALLPDGERLQMVWTDPPYGVAYVGKTADALTIQNDALDEEQLLSFLQGALGAAAQHSMAGASWYVAAPPGPLFHVFGTVLKDLGVWRHTLVWAKDRFVLGRCDYHYRHEAVFYGWVPGAAHYFIDDRTQDSVHDIPRPSVSADHPTMKPVALVQKHIENSSKRGWLVGEPFGGSGTTLLACAQTGRIARLIELDPHYCDVIRRRWTTWAREHGQDPGPGALD